MMRTRVRMTGIDEEGRGREEEWQCQSKMTQAVCLSCSLTAFSEQANDCVLGLVSQWETYPVENGKTKACSKP
jgi:hypothetical protein